jgi:hypothetical protein
VEEAAVSRLVPYSTAKRAIERLRPEAEGRAFRGRSRKPEFCAVCFEPQRHFRQTNFRALRPTLYFPSLATICVEISPIINFADQSISICGGAHSCKRCAAKPGARRT